jgi:hypothetical protein
MARQHAGAGGGFNEDGPSEPPQTAPAGDVLDLHPASPELAILVAPAQNDVMNSLPTNAPPPLRKKRPWWLYLLVGLGVLVVVGVVALLSVFLYGRSLVRNYTATSPRTFPAAQANRDQQRVLQGNWEEFIKAVQSAQPPPPFKISSEDINSFMAGNRGMSKQVHFVITNNELLAEFSFPLGQTGQPFLKDRYFNGVAHINVHFADGWLTVGLGRVEANGKPIPNLLLKRLQQENFVKGIDRNPDLVNAMHEMESVEIRDGYIVLTPHVGTR